MVNGLWSEVAPPTAGFAPLGGSLNSWAAVHGLSGLSEQLGERAEEPWDDIATAQRIVTVENVHLGQGLVDMRTGERGLLP